MDQNEIQQNRGENVGKMKSSYTTKTRKLTDFTTWN